MTLKSHVRRVINTKKAASGASAVGGMVVGAVVGIAVQAGVESTGLLGPSVEALFAEQEANFGEIDAQLAALRALTEGTELAGNVDSLQILITEQAALQTRSAEQIGELAGEVSQLRDQSLGDTGFSGGADVWLKSGESISVGNNRNVLGVIRVWDAAIDVSLNGTKHRLGIGGKLDVEDTNCSVFVKHGRRDEDARGGFDVVCE